ncbi:MAG TPA: nucleoside hydrolase [Chloroflexota bacterium]|nr:nucleoside hydrolase [Chloroflexota bacterium]
MPRKIILDCDPGHDDAMAIILAAGNPDISLQAITTVAGNQTLPKVTLNAQRVCTVAGITNVPVIAGCAGPLVRPLVVAPDIHGESGLDGPQWPEPTVPVTPGHAVDAIIDLVMAAGEGEMTLVPTGPLTNIAMAVRKEPRLVPRVREVVLMGGAYTRGNVTPAAEFNIYVDPEAADIVFSADWSVTMVGLDLTHQARATSAVVDRIAALDTPVARMVVDLLHFFGSSYQQEQGFEAPPVHDPTAVARVINPALVECADAFVAVETMGKWTAGMTVTDFRGKLGFPLAAHVATRLDFDGFWSLMIDAIAAVGQGAAVS